MGKAYFKLIMTPAVYLWFCLKTVFKWIIVVPLIAIFCFIKNAIFGIIIAIVAGIFLTPIASAIVIVIVAIAAIVMTKDDVMDRIPECFENDWNYCQKVKREIVRLKNEREKRLIEEKMLEEYDNYRDEFIGFNKLSDIYISWD